MDTTAIRRRAVEFEASTWLHGDTAGAECMFDKQATWARTLDTAGRRHHAAGMWHANRLLELAAINVVQIELGERTGFTR